MVSFESTLKICSPDLVGKSFREIGIAVNNMLSPNFDGRLNADADGINFTDVACLSVVAKIFVVSLIGLLAAIGSVPQEMSNSRSGKNIRLDALIELLLTVHNIKAFVKAYKNYCCTSAAGHAVVLQMHLFCAAYSNSLLMFSETSTHTIDNSFSGDEYSL